MAINSHFARRGLPFHSVDGITPGMTAVAMPESKGAMGLKVSIIIPTRDGGIASNWLGRARGLFSVPTIGIVSARLLYPDRTIQHFGIHLGLGPQSPDSPYAGQDASDLGFAGKSALQQFSAVTAACLFIRREDFIKVGGFEPELGVAFNDVDLCLKIKEASLQIVCDPEIELFHKESQSRGLDVTPAKRERLYCEAEWMRRKWEKVLDADPLFNPNFDLMRGDYSPAFPPRATLPCRVPRQENAKS